MKKMLLCLGFLCITSTALAYNPLVVDPEQPYDIIPIEGDPYVEHQFLGSLTDYPEMYELTTDVAITFKATLRQKSSKKAVPFALIMVRQNDDDGGVTEVARLNQPLNEWKEVSEPGLGMTFLESEVFEKELIPGTYRIEVSTPENKGDYMLTIGDEAMSVGYFKALSHIRTTQKHFGYTPFHLLFSSYLFYPLGILGVLYGMYRTWRYRKGI